MCTRCYNIATENKRGFYAMKLTKEALKGLRKMIENTTAKVLVRYENDNLNNQVEVENLFIGDSMIEFMNLGKYLPELNTLNRGVAGATTMFVRNHLDTIFGLLEPKNIFISIGSNDLVLLESSVDEAFKQVIDLLDIIEKKYPKTKIYYLSTTPVVSENHKLYKKNFIGGRTNGELKALNYKIKTYLDNQTKQYIHLFDCLLDDKGYLNSAYTADGIHLNSEGYQVYAKNIMDAI